MFCILVAISPVASVTDAVSALAVSADPVSCVAVAESSEVEQLRFVEAFEMRRKTCCRFAMSALNSRL